MTTIFILLIALTGPDGHFSQVVDSFPTRALCVAEMNRTIDAVRGSGYRLRQIECVAGGRMKPDINDKETP